MIIVFDDDASGAVLSRFSRRPWKGACLKDVAGLTLWDGRKKRQALEFTWPGRIPCRSLSSLLQNVDSSDLKNNRENTEAGNARVQKHLVTAAKQIETSILKCSRAKAGICMNLFRFAS